MRNIIRIFTSDAKRLATNVVAVVMIIGLTVIPSLYAWFNIMSNWDPYGEASTANLNVVVASCDQGTEIEGVELNIGNMVVSNLKENKTIGWVFVDSEEEAVDGVQSGDYYAALVIDEANKMNTMVKRLLTLNQIEFGNDEPEMERFDINELIASVADANAIRAGQKNMSIVFDNRNEHNFVWADEYKTEEVH